MTQTPRILQQQPERETDREQQQSKPQGRQEPMGEGSYEGTRDYNQRTEEYLKTHDVEKDAAAARPQSEEEARDMERAEEEGKSHSRGEK
jgi:hypothetical protein